MFVVKVARIMILSCMLLLLTTPLNAQQYPSRPIRILVGFAAGGTTDGLARIYAQKLQELLGTAVIVENRPGASQLLAIQALMAASPDGYTLWLGTSSALAQGPSVRTDLPYDSLKSFSHVSMIATAPGIFIVNPTLPIHTVNELVSYAKANPDKLFFSSAGVGAANHIQFEYLMKVTGTSMTHVPFKSDQQASFEVVAGTVGVSVLTANFAVPLALDGKVRPLAVVGTKRLSALPDVPAISELDMPEVKGINYYTFYGLVGPAGMAPAIIERLNDASNKVSALPDFQNRLREALFMESVAGSPKEFRDYLEGELARWRQVGTSIRF